MINSKRTLVAYLDIMGYREIINNKSPDDFYDSIAFVFENLQLLMAGVQPKKLESRAEIERQCLADLIKTVKFKIMSDAIIMYCDFNDIEHVNKKYYEKVDHDYSGTVLFFHVLSSFVLLFISGTGYLLRGGVCLDEFYTNTFDSLLDGELIFSKAFVRGYELEQLANYPRILVDEPLYDIWKSRVESLSVQKSKTEGQVKRDRDGELYVDLYEFLRGYPKDLKKKSLESIIKQIKIMLAKKEDDRRIWKKWHWFKEYHNEKIRSFAKSENQDLNELLIN